MKSASRNAQLREKLQREFGPERVLAAEPLARHCNWKAGGPAELFLEVRTCAELIFAAREAFSADVALTVLGFGANVLIADAGLRGLVILNRADRFVFHNYNQVEADSGTNLAMLVKKAAGQGAAGLEFLTGIPGTVGGAVYGNAGTGSTWVSTVVHRVRVLNRSGELLDLTVDQLDFSYRQSRLKNSKEVVVKVWLDTHEDRPENVMARIEQLTLLRKNQPGGSSTGSVFKNPSGDFAGRLLEEAGLKGYKIGAAQISAMHANFILNLGGATASDIRALIHYARRRVAERFGVALQEEIQYLGDWH